MLPHGCAPRPLHHPVLNWLWPLASPQGDLAPHGSLGLGAEGLGVLQLSPRPSSAG